MKYEVPRYEVLGHPIFVLEKQNTSFSTSLLRYFNTYIPTYLHPTYIFKRQSHEDQTVKRDRIPLGSVFLFYP
jgi:hypothetical protein